MNLSQQDMPFWQVMALAALPAAVAWLSRIGIAKKRDADDIKVSLDGRLSQFIESLEKTEAAKIAVAFAEGLAAGRVQGRLLEGERAAIVVAAAREEDRADERDKRE